MKPVVISDLPLFDGRSFSPEKDGARLASHLTRVRDFLVTHQPAVFTLQEIAEACGGTEASCSARVRDLRKSRWGSYDVVSQRDASVPSLWRYGIRGGPGDGKPDHVCCPNCGERISREARA